jgi:hypothetical protein
MVQVLDAISLHEIAEDHLHSLVLLRVPESVRIEYKRELKMSTDKERRELCKDISALANSQGGYLFFAIAETNGIPTSIPGIQFDDAAKQQLFEILTSGISPRVQNLSEREVSLRNSLKVIILKIEPDGYLHQVKYGDNRYYKRTGTITISMESSDVETFFRSTGPLTRKEEVQEIIDGYYAALKSKKYFKGIEGKGIIVLAIVPEVSSIKLDLSNLPSNFTTLFQPIYCSGWSSEITGRSRFTFGRLPKGHFGSEGADHVPHAVTEVTEFGEVKAYNSSMLENRYGEPELLKHCAGYVPNVAYEREIIIAFHRYLTSLRELGVSGPFFIHTAMLNVQGYIMATDPMRMLSGGRVFQGEDIRPLLDHLPNDTYFATKQDVAKALRPMFDYIWREFGFDRSFNYSETGEWIPET